MKNPYLYRFIDDELLAWSESQNRKPLLLRGARQVGKTTAVRKLSGHFEYYIEVNLEEHRDVWSFFQNNLTIKEILENLSIYFNAPIKTGNTLLFFDEIQACSAALSSLRYFYEQYPDLHVIAAGSLLEFSLHSVPSFGVGRIRSLFVYPLSFNEFLMASGEGELCRFKSQQFGNPMFNEAMHQKLIRYTIKFIILGGMPEVIRKYLVDNDILECQRVMDDLLITYRDDFAKYKERVPATRIDEVFLSVVQQLGGKFMYAKASSQAHHQQISESLELLIKAGLVIQVIQSTADGIPLGARVRPKNRKMLIIDTGLALRLAGLDIREILQADHVELMNKGSIAELFVGIEMLKANSPFERKELYYWQREAQNSNAEIDYLIQKGTRIIPIEVKSGTRGKMQSLHLFLNEKGIDKGVRVSHERFASFGNILVVPIYAVRDFIQRKEMP